MFSSQPSFPITGFPFPQHYQLFLARGTILTHGTSSFSFFKWQPYKMTHEHIVGWRKPTVTNCLPSRSGCWPASPLLGSRVPGVLPIICLSLRILRLLEDVEKPPEHPQQRTKLGDNSQIISDGKFQVKTRPTSLKPAPFPQYACLIGHSTHRASNWTGVEALTDVRVHNPHLHGWERSQWHF
jgi:hypothetical protein